MNVHSKTVLVTGGTGFIGKALCSELIASGFDVYVLTRRKRSLQATDQNTIKYLTSLDALAGKDIDVIINLAGETISQRWTRQAKKNIYDSRIVTTQRIVDFMKTLHKRPTVLISGSAVGYYGTDPQKVFVEETGLTQEQGFAQQLCQTWEEEAKQAEHLGVRVVLLRIGPVLEKGGGMLSKLFPSFYLGLGGIIGNGQQWLSWIDRDDLIALILFIIANPQLYGPINATAPQPVTNADFSKTFAKILNRPCFIKTPGFLLKTIFGEMADEIMLQGQKVVPQKALHHGFKFRYPTIDQSLQKIFR